jgi:hypothetical protein
MNCRISEPNLRSVCRELLSSNSRVSHRTLCKVLRERFGAAGKTARVSRIWREEAARLTRSQLECARQPTVLLPTNVLVLQERMALAEASAEQLRSRAELAELREQSHQEHWALEIDRLREQIRAQPNYAREIQRLQNAVMRLTAELSVFRGARLEKPAGEGESR